MKKIDEITLKNVIEITLETGNKIYVPSDFIIEGTSTECCLNVPEDTVMKKTYYGYCDVEDDLTYDSLDFELCFNYTPQIY